MLLLRGHMNNNSQGQPGITLCPMRTAATPWFDYAALGCMNHCQLSWITKHCEGIFQSGRWDLSVIYLYVGLCTQGCHIAVATSYQDASSALRLKAIEA